MEQIILIIDPGHGGRDPGGGNNAHWQEKDFVLTISLYQLKRFQELGIGVEMTRKDDTYLDNTARTRIVRESGARYCISNHINAGGGEGAETIYSIHSDGNLAKRILEALEEAGQSVRRAFTRTSTSNPERDYYFMHSQTGSVETIIVEYGFADNQQDVERLQNHWQQYAEAVVKAFCAHIDHPYQTPAAEADDQWKYEGIDYLHQEGILMDPEGWRQKINEPMPVWAVTLLLHKLHQSLRTNQ